MKIAVVGAGNIATAYARVFAEQGLTVWVGARAPGKAADLAERVGSGALGGSTTSACEGAAVVLLAAPFQAYDAVLSEAGNLSGKVVINVSNPISADYQGMVIGTTTSAAESLQASTRPTR